jgi:hypothetical protein
MLPVYAVVFITYCVGPQVLTKINIFYMTLLACYCKHIEKPHTDVEIWPGRNLPSVQLRRANGLNMWSAISGSFIFDGSHVNIGFVCPFLLIVLLPHCHVCVKESDEQQWITDHEFIHGSSRTRQIPIMFRRK